ncbi:hypothetical protein [Belliella aquatica]|nr:hypothetical protein [Belliella aquatica]
MLISGGGLVSGSGGLSGCIGKGVGKLEDLKIERLGLNELIG